MRRSWRAVLASALVTVGLVAVTATGARAGNGYFTYLDLATVGGGSGDVGPQAPQWYTPWDRTRHVAYVYGETMDIGSKPWNSTTWSWITVPVAAERYDWLAAYAYSWDHSSHVDYTDNDGHLHELWSSAASPAWHDADLTVVTGAPLNLQVTSGFEQGGAQHLVAGGSGTNDFWELDFRPASGWQATDLSTETGIKGTDRPFGVGRGDTYGQTIAYFGVDDRMHTLTWTSTSGWSDVAVTGRLRSVGEPRIFSSPAGDRVTIAYHEVTQDSNGVPVPSLHMTTWTPSTGWVDTNVTAVTGTSDIATDTGAGAYLQSDGSYRYYQMTVYSEVIQEFVHSSNGQWSAWTDTPQSFTNGGLLSVLSFPADNQGWRWTLSVSCLDSNNHFDLLDLTI